MNKDSLRNKLLSHPMAGWCNPVNSFIPKINNQSRLLWCGIGGALSSSEAIVRIFASDNRLRDWIPLASPELFPLKLQPYDQIVFASQSGKTIELWTWIGRLRAMSGWSTLINPPIIITNNGTNPLIQWARNNNYQVLQIPLDIGGRYAAFTLLGTLPLTWMGLDVDAFLQGGQEVSKSVMNGSGLWATRIWEMVKTLHEGYLAGIQEWVLLPYNQCIEPLTTWWVQLVAESLGKIAKDGTRRGLTPIRSVGPMDQHTQLQRWLVGPKNIGLVILTINDHTPSEQLRIPDVCPYPALAKLQGSTVLAAQAEGTREALEAAGVPVIHWVLEPLNERSLGELMMAWQLIISLTGFSLEIDPFDQPAVEDGKIRTLRKLNLI
jgi:glucose-6-phosphate isomerase